MIQRQIISGGDGDEPICEYSQNPLFHEIVAGRRLRRRDVLLGGLAAAMGAVFARSHSFAAEPMVEDLIGFRPVPVSRTDNIVVPKGYQADVILPWGEPILGSTPAFDLGNSGQDQAMQIGSHHDGLHYFAIDGSSSDGLFVMNHEYVEPRLMHQTAVGQKLGPNSYLLKDGRRPADEVLKEVNGHGASVTRIRKAGDGKWNVVPDPRNRRITGLTPMELRGPVRGSDLVKTKYSPDGTRTRGTLNNCAHGVTPWNTYITAEENWAAYFVNRDIRDEKPNVPREHGRYGVSTTRSRYGWELADSEADEFTRFDVSTKAASALGDYRNEPNTFGWLVEFDPFRPDRVPLKHTALGRFAHEGVVFAPAKVGEPVVCYSADDATFEYIYKFVSAQTYDPGTAGSHLLESGTLYVARFNEDGTGEWLPLVFGELGLTPQNGFHSQADILVNTRTAADFVRPTRMDRPEWGAIEPSTGAVYFTLTNNTRRQPGDVDKANPRAKNEFGHIIRWLEAGGDHSATHFNWDLFIIAGGSESSQNAGAPMDESNLFACPDGLWFDDDGRLWIQTDIGEAEQLKGALGQFGNNAMLCADPKTGALRRFLTGPLGQEITGVVTTPDRRTMFVNVQHPGATTSAEDFAAGRFDSLWPFGTSARSCTVVITKEDGGVIGS